MRKNAIWCIPCAFFIITVVLNLVGCIQGTKLDNLVKPALLPLLSATTLAYLLGRDIVDFRPVGLLVAAQLFGFAGDTLLLPSGFWLFLAGMAAFLIGHLCYMTLFGGISWKGLTPVQWIIAIVVMGAVAFPLVKVTGISGQMFWPMVVYGFALLVLVFSTFAGVLRMPRGSRSTWWILLAGALLFLSSDMLLAMSIFGTLKFALRSFVIMATYLAAQSLLAIGGVRLILGR